MKKSTDYIDKLDATKAADLAHEKMMQWYAVKLKCNRDDVRDKLDSTSDSILASLYDEYRETQLCQ